MVSLTTHRAFLQLAMFPILNSSSGISTNNNVFPLSICKYGSLNSLRQSTVVFVAALALIPQKSGNHPEIPDAPQANLQTYLVSRLPCVFVKSHITYSRGIQASDRSTFFTAKLKFAFTQFLCQFDQVWRS